MPSPAPASPPVPGRPLWSIPWGPGPGELGLRSVRTGAGAPLVTGPSSFLVDPVRRELTVADTANRRIQMFDATGAGRTLPVEGVDPLVAPGDLLRLPDGTLLVTDAGRVLLVGPDGARSRSGGAELIGPLRLAGGSGPVACADEALGRIVALDPESGRPVVPYNGSGLAADGTGALHQPAFDFLRGHVLEPLGWTSPSPSPRPLDLATPLSVEVLAVADRHVDLLIPVRDTDRVRIARLDDFGRLATRGTALLQTLGEGLVLFGEYCAAVHSLEYDRLPDWFLGFDILEPETGRFWSASRRDQALSAMGIQPVPPLARGRFTHEEVVARLASASSRLRQGPVEGFYLRWDAGDWLTARAKLVRAEFTQAIREHWSRHPIRWNRTDPTRETRRYR